MIAYLQQYVLYILGGVIVLLLIFGGVQTVRLKLAVATLTAAQAEKAKIESQMYTQNQAVKQLVEKGEEQNQVIKEAWDKLKQKPKIVYRDAPKDCEGAAQWAFEMIPKLGAQ
jgi:membrane-bound lytic murein transglycosylase B